MKHRAHQLITLKCNYYERCRLQCEGLVVCIKDYFAVRFQQIVTTLGSLEIKGL